MRIVDREVKILGDPKRVFLGGISQGCSVVLGAWLKGPHILGGILGSGGCLCLKIDWENLKKEDKKKTPLLLYHGVKDEVFKL